MNSVWIAVTHFTQCTGPIKQHIIKISINASSCCSQK